MCRILWIKALYKYTMYVYSYSNNPNKPLENGKQNNLVRNHFFHSDTRKFAVDINPKMLLNGYLIFLWNKYTFATKLWNKKCLKSKHFGRNLLIMNFSPRCKVIYHEIIAACYYGTKTYFFYKTLSQAQYIVSMMFFLLSLWCFTYLQFFICV